MERLCKSMKLVYKKKVCFEVYQKSQANYTAKIF